jgi:hypothetical protein
VKSGAGAHYTCTAQVTSKVKTSAAPTGKVTFHAGSGSLSPATCTLTAAGKGVANCGASVSYRAAKTIAPYDQPPLTGQHSGDGAFTTSTGKPVVTKTGIETWSATCAASTKGTASWSAKISPGASAQVKLKLDSAGRKTLSGKRSLKLTLAFVISSKDAKTVHATYHLTVKLPPKPKGKKKK